MANTSKMNSSEMFRAIINGQSAMKSELLQRIDKIDAKISNLQVKVDDGFAKVNKRLDSIGKSVAYLEDDAPTSEEHDNLEKRVKKIENKLALT